MRAAAGVTAAAAILAGGLTAAAQRPLDRHLATLTEMASAVNAADAARYAATYSADAVITIFGGTQLKGRAAIEQYEQTLLREFPGTRFALQSVWQHAGRAVVHYAVNDGTRMGHEGLLFYRFDSSGLIQEERRYNDSLTPMAQLGLLGAGPVRALPQLASEPRVYAFAGSSRETANVSIAKAALAAIDAKNQPAFLATVADDVVVDELIDRQPAAGRANVARWFQGWAEAVPDLTSEVTTMIGVEDFVLLETVARGTLKASRGRFSPSPRPAEVHRAAIVRLRDGKIVRLSAFMNGKELAETTGQWPLR
jgi:steroid delta-isomerase-like uncharacterized protein